MEACGAAHHWARVLGGLGHEVRLIAPEAVRPFVKRSKKNDAVDAAAICAAASRPEARFVPVKSVEQQGVLALHAARGLLVKQQTMLANAARGLATEFGLVVPKGLGRLEDLEALVAGSSAVPEEARRALIELLDGCRAVGGRIAQLEAEIVAHAAGRRRATPRHRPWHWAAGRLAHRRHGRRQHRHVPEWAALRGLARPRAAAELDGRQDPPRADHEGGQPGGPTLPRARGHVRCTAPQVGRALSGRGWGLLARRPARLATVALANKMARIAWALMTRGGTYQPRGAVAAVI